MTTSESERGLTDEGLREMWRKAGGDFHGPNVETGTMPEHLLLPFLCNLLALSSAGQPVAWQVIAKGGRFTRGIYEKPTADDFEIWRLDGDTAIPLFAHPAPTYRDGVLAAKRWEIFKSNPSYFHSCWFPEDYDACADAMIDAYAKGENPAGAAIEHARSINAVPEGWQVVPIVPDDETLVAGQEAWVHSRIQRPAVEDCVEAQQVWDAMLKVSPTIDIHIPRALLGPKAENGDKS